ncbi:hypothetical protein GCM10029978_108390 [Actinoallomurus acanthiterrae]
MRIQKRMALAASGAAFVGTMALGLGAAVPAGAQVTAAPHRASTAFSGIRTDGGYGYGYGYGRHRGRHGYGYGYGYHRPRHGYQYGYQSSRHRHAYTY